MGVSKTPRLSNEEGRTFEVEADSLKEAEKEVNSRLPKGLQLLSRKIISDGKPKMSLGIAETIEAAFQEARSGLPSSAIVTEDKILVPPGITTIMVDALDERTARSRARYEGCVSALQIIHGLVNERRYEALAFGGRINESVRSGKLTLKSSGSKGFLGMGKKPNSYEIQIVQSAVVQVTYKERARIRATVGKEKLPRKRRAMINRVEICFDSEPRLPIPEKEAVEQLVHHFNLAKSFTRDVHISTSYGKVPKVAESLRTSNCAKELAYFVITRALVLGMDEKEVAEIVPRPFVVGKTLGVLIAGHVKSPWSK